LFARRYARRGKKEAVVKGVKMTQGQVDKLGSGNIHR